jgi:phenylpyruvate tautomerase PptA (4-oxalocrotonate tautomerase family)
VILISKEYYAENDSTENFYPVFVSVLKVKLPSLESMQAEVAKLTEAVAQICGRPQENVHILFLPEAAGRIAFGGKLAHG